MSGRTVTRRAVMNRERFGTVDERADRVLAYLRRAGGIVPGFVIATDLAFPAPVLGGALSRLLERGDAERHGQQGWAAR